MATPLTNGDNGRLADGRFAKGNRGGPGNPYSAAVGVWRATLVEAVTADDLRIAIKLLVDKAKAGEPWAVRELLDRCLGKAKQPVEVDAYPSACLPNDYLEFLDQRATNDTQRNG